MAETQIRVEVDAFKEAFPFYVRIVSKRLKIELKSIKKYKQYFLINLIADGDKSYQFIENLYNFGNLFNIQTVKFDYIPLTK